MELESNFANISLRAYKLHGERKAWKARKASNILAKKWNEI